MEMKDLDRILLIISIGIFIVILIFRLIPSKTEEYSSMEIKSKVERDINLEIEEKNTYTNPIKKENENHNKRGPYPPFVEFTE
uniref:Uncharacterized protein n=1 Tax=Dictyoglomus thermophilum TaxID=14 RepID=A0A7C3MN44_DICTH